MNEETFNNAIRKFLKQVGITSQQEIEKAVQAAIDAGSLRGNETLHARVDVRIEELDMHHEIEAEIPLE